MAKGLSEEIRRLAVLVDEFSDPFHPDPLVYCIVLMYILKLTVGIRPHRVSLTQYRIL